jgi:hypothetical protein
MTDQPKLPNGPSAQGAAGVRALGGGYQVRYAADFVAKTRGEFSRVEATGGYPYNSKGVYKAGTASSAFIASSYKAKFVKTSQIIAVLDCDFGKTASWNISWNYFYTYYTATQRVTVKGVVIDSFALRLTVVENNTLLPPVYYIGRVKTSEGTAALVGTVSTKDLGRTDTNGFICADPVIHRTFILPDGTAASDETGITVPLNDEAYVSPRWAASSAIIYVLLAHSHYAVSGTPTATAPVYLCTSRDLGYTWEHVDIAAYAFGDFPLTSYSQANAAVASAFMAMYVVMMDNDEALIAFPRKTAAGTYGSRVVKLSGLTATTVYDGAPGALVPYPASLVFAGDNTIVMKRNLGYDGINYDTDFLVSFNRGDTWDTYTPTGLDAPLKNQYFGDLKVDMAANGRGRAARILMTGWNPSDLSYYVYSTVNYGLSWTRGAKITESDVFRRVDTTISGDGGGNFRTLNIFSTPNSPRTVDVSVPKRYTRHAV